MIQRAGLTHWVQLDQFMDWLLDAGAQVGRGGTGRSFRDAPAWCWRIPAHLGEPTGVIPPPDHARWRLPTADACTSSTPAPTWWAGNGVTTRKSRLVSAVETNRGPVVTSVDGGTGLHAALRQQWSHAAVWMGAYASREAK